MTIRETPAYFTENDIFAKRLTEIMKERGTDQTKLAEKIKREQGRVLQRQTISQYTRGQSKPDTDRLTMLCKALNISPSYLLGLSDEKDPNEKLQAAYRDIGLNSREIKNIRKIKEYGAIDGLHVILDNPAILLLCNDISKLIRISRKILDDKNYYQTETDRVQQIRAGIPGVTILTPYEEIGYQRHAAAQCFEGIIGLSTGATEAIRFVMKQEAPNGEHQKD